MESLSASDILLATGGVLALGEVTRRFSGVSTDSRTVGVGELFIPLQGERFDGHGYIRQALQAGAAGFLFAVEPGGDVQERLRELGLIESDVAFGNAAACAIGVPETLEALQAIAAHYRAQFAIPVVAVTGSVGKTSTKEIIASVLRQRLSVVATAANYNNEIGLAQTIFGLDRASEALVVEMGMRGLGQIRELVAIARPTVGVVTNVGDTHLELLGSRENIARAKAELVEGLPAGGVAVLNGDDPLVARMKNECKSRVVTYGLGGPGDAEPDYLAYHVESFGVRGIRFEVCSGGVAFPVELGIPGVHNVHNALAAVAVGLELGLSIDEIRGGLAGARLTGMRLAVTETPSGLTVINDAYNASPASVRAALRILMESRGEGRAIAILGDMLELGPVSETAHAEIGDYAAKLGVELLVGVGTLSAYTVNAARHAGLRDVWAFDSNDSAAAALPALLRDKDVVLVKGSRGMRMETIVKALTMGGDLEHV